jgi:hypothetical protein
MRGASLGIAVSVWSGRGRTGLSAQATAPSSVPVATLATKSHGESVAWVGSATPR